MMVCVMLCGFSGNVGRCGVWFCNQFCQCGCIGLLVLLYWVRLMMMGSFGVFLVIVCRCCLVSVVFMLVLLLIRMMVFFVLVSRIGQMQEKCFCFGDLYRCRWLLFGRLMLLQFMVMVVYCLFMEGLVLWVFVIIVVFWVNVCMRVDLFVLSGFIIMILCLCMVMYFSGCEVVVID